jgi:hypothetical protein
VVRPNVVRRSGCFRVQYAQDVGDLGVKAIDATAGLALAELHQVAQLVDQGLPFPPASVLLHRVRRCFL